MRISENNIVKVKSLKDKGGHEKKNSNYPSLFYIGYLYRESDRSLRYNSMQNSKHERSLKHTLRAPLTEEGHALHPS